MLLRCSIIIFLFFLNACGTIEDPVAKYNREFLKTNSMKIRRQKNKHLKIANENNIYYRENKTDLVDADYYEPIRGTKLKRDFRNKKTIEDIPDVGDIEYMDSDLSLYYRQRNLKDPQYYDDDNSQKILYLAENYKDYSEERVDFDIEPTSDKLYGTIEERKDKNYNYIDSSVMQENFDYIDIMNRVKNEIYLKQKEEETKNKSNNTGIINSVVNKFKNLFNKKSN